MSSPLGACDHHCADAEAGVLLLYPRTSTIDARHKVSPKTSTILHTNCRLFTQFSLPHVVLVYDWMLTFSDMFPDLLQHFHHIDTADTKMLASDRLLSN